MPAARSTRSCSGSIRVRRASAELGQLFFEPLQLHLQPTNLLVQLGDRSVLSRCRLSPGRANNSSTPVHQPPLPLVNLCRMHTELIARLAGPCAPPHRRQRTLGDEPRPMLPLPRHPCPPGPRPFPRPRRPISYYLNPWSSFWGPLHSKPLGVCPLGTLNHFAKDLRLPLILEEAVEVIARGEERPRRCRCSQRSRLHNNSSLGIYPHIVRERDEMRVRLALNKWLALVPACLSVFRRYPMVEVRWTPAMKAST